MTTRQFLVLWLASLLAAACLVPVLVVAAAQRGTPTPWGATFALVLVSAAVFFAAVVYVGLRVGAGLGLGAPIVAGWVRGSVPEDALHRLSAGAGLGLLLGVVAVIAAVIIAASDTPTGGATAEVLPVWSGVALSVFAAIDEELLFRFFLMTVIVWAVARVMPPRTGAPTDDLGMWIAIGFTALIFEAAHVTPVSGAELSVIESRSLQIVRLTAALLLGWLYWRKGLESAMAMHFAYNMVFFYGVVLAV